MTPDLRNRPHTYRDTGKAGLHIGISGVNGVDSEKSTVNDVDSAVNDVDSQSQPGLLEDSNKKALKTQLHDFPADWQIAGGLSSDKIAKHNEKEQAERQVADNFERQMGFNPLPWWSDKDLGALLRFLMDKSPEEVAKFAEWAKRDFSSLKPAKARQYPRLVIECWPQAFDNPKKTGRTLRQS
jgi:hypothetical protein